MDPTDLDLLRAHVAGDPLAFACILELHEAWLFSAARRRLRDDHLADDARQVVFVLLAEKAATLVADEERSIAAWLFHTMHFTCAGIVRTRARQARREAAVAGVSDGTPRPDDAILTALEDTITQLPPRDREAVVRRFYQHETFDQIGTALGITEEAARKRVTRTLDRCRVAMSIDGIDTRPDEMLEGQKLIAAIPNRSKSNRAQIASLAKETRLMVQQTESIQFAVMTAEFFVTSVEDNLDFFEKLGFRRHFIEPTDAAGTASRAAMRGGHARIWLRRASKANPPAPGVIVYFWLDGGEPAVIRHRESVAAQGIVPNQYFYDGALMNFTVTTPDGYTVGFFSTYEPRTYDSKSDG